ncbi:GGDEF domain-containing protein [Devosia limi]|uniref:diguanylate cyclase n=1 Tax=Devosia limi DSM 17137 TaxID=1121477 RepID=A0A1M4XED5_9HYPH|nr:GGDEF domain-containing protein [Devosia limi]SHE91845.1 diguanylate cyclase (GGDEF) domain-containing protein [Devosia limi DSM 17137]
MPPQTVTALQSWSSVGKWTLLGTIASVAISAIVNALIFSDLGSEALRRSILSALILPVLIGMPLFLYLSLRLRGLAISNIKLGLVARTDSLTACLNRGAFAAKVDTILARPNTEPSGALLMIDADNFKAINDLFGHDAGDEALTIIARTIRATLRPGDLVGRMGGEEFGVYLPRVDVAEAHAAAERIRASIYQADFAPNGGRHTLSVSIGGTVFARRASFSELFRIADQRLYGAKQAGRNRVTIVDALDHPDINHSDIALAQAYKKGGAHRAAFDYLDRTGA